MPRNQYAVNNSFLNSFMQGYSFIDNIQRNKRREKRLEEQLAIRNQRQARMDELVYEQRRFLKDDRSRAATMRERDAEARAIMATESPDVEALRDYTDVPGVSDFIRQELERTGRKADVETSFAGDPSFQQQVQGAAQQQQPAAPGDPTDPTQLPSTAVQGGNLGVDPSVPPPNAMQRPGVQELITKDMTADQINEAVRNKTMTEEEAREQFALRDIDDLGQSANAYERALKKRIRDKRDEKLAGARDQIANADRIAESFTDLQDRDGDIYRNWTPQQAADWYHENRSNISDPKVRENMDKQMEERIASSLNASRSIMMDDNIPTESNEFRNAQRRYAKGLGLVQAVTTSRQPDELAGSDNRGVSRRNTAMIDNTITAAGQGRPAPMPGNPNKHRADMAIASRGNASTRVGKKYADAAYGLLSRGIIDINVYGAMIKTGAPLGDILAAQGISQKIVQGDPSKDTFIDTINPDGTVSRKLIIPARKIPSAKDLKDQYRNTFGGAAIDHLYNHLSKSYNTDDDPDRGVRTVNSFIADMAPNEASARANGYSYENLNDIAMLYQRWADAHVIEDVYNRELSGGWFDKPTFSQTYGSIDQRIFDRSFDQDVQQVIQDEGLETSGGNELRLTGLKEIGGAEVGFLRQQFPNETAQMSDMQIREIVLDQAQQLGR